MKTLLLWFWIICTFMFGVINTNVVSSAWLLSVTNPYDGSDVWESEDVKVPWTWTNQTDAFVNVVKGAVNWVLGILALIALLILLWWGFQMVTSAGNDDQYGKGFTILKHAAAGLLLIGVAWFIISIIFWLANQITNAPWTANTNQ